MANHKIRGRARARMQECRFCGHRFSADLVQCSSCRQWNWEEELTEDDGTSTLAEADDRPLQTMQTGPWDICFSNQRGIPHGPVVTGTYLLGGTPGAGKSTLSIQLAACIAETTMREVLFVAAEQDKEEIRAFAIRLGVKNLGLIRIYPMTAKTDLSKVLLKRRPAGVVIDSLPGLTDDPAEAAVICKNAKAYAVDIKAPIIIIDHVNKEKDFAGLMALQHHVDALITIFPIKDNRGAETDIRVMQSHKNRFGASAEVMLQMTENGLIEYHEEDESQD